MYSDFSMNPVLHIKPLSFPTEGEGLGETNTNYTSGHRVSKSLEEGEIHRSQVASAVLGWAWGGDKYLFIKQALGALRPCPGETLCPGTGSRF